MNGQRFASCAGGCEIHICRLIDRKFLCHNIWWAIAMIGGSDRNIEFTRKFLTVCGIIQYFRAIRILWFEIQFAAIRTPAYSGCIVFGGGYEKTVLSCT